MGCSILRVRLEQRKLNFAKNKYKKTKNNKPIVKTDSPKNTPTGKNQQKKSPSEKQNHKNKLKINNTKSKLNVPNCFFCFVYVLFFYVFLSLVVWFVIPVFSVFLFLKIILYNPIFSVLLDSQT